MAQKSKAATKRSAKAVTSKTPAGKTKAKAPAKSAAKAKASAKAAAKPAAKVAGKATTGKPAPKSKPVAASAKAKSGTAPAAAPLKLPTPAPARPTVSNPKIAHAKSALKREKAASARAQATGATDATVKPEKPRSRKISIEINPNEAASALAAKWSTLFKKSEQIEAKPYNMTAVFEERTAIVHKVLGWGYILANRNDRLEVLFKDGIKYLISNYKP